MVKYPPIAQMYDYLKQLENSLENSQDTILQELLAYRKNFLKLFELKNKKIFSGQINNFIELQLGMPELDVAINYQCICTKKEIIIGNIEYVFKYHPEIKAEIVNYFQDLAYKGHAWELFIASIYTSCLVISIAENVSLESPLIIEDILSRVQEYRLVIIIVNAGAHVVLHPIIQKKHYVYGQHIMLKVKPHASVTYNNDSDYIATIFDSEQWYIDAYADVKIMQTVTSQAASIVIRDYSLIGEYAQLYWYGATALSDSDACAFITYQKHYAAYTNSSLELRGVLQDSAQLLYHGIIDIGSKAMQAQAQQQELALLLSKTARHCAVPALEIKNAQVSCKHGSATGVIDQEQLWYLLSYGISNEQAQKLILDGFFELDHSKAHNNTRAARALERIKNKIKNRSSV